MPERKVSVVVPVYRSAQSLPQLVERTLSTLQAASLTPELIFVDDRSPDNSWGVLCDLQHKYPEYIKIARFQKNMGQHSAICAGLTMATGGIVITMDDDLQNPPEEIPKLIGRLDEGFDLVIAAYDSKKHSSFRNFFGYLIDSTLRNLFNLPKSFQLTSFRAFNSSVIGGIGSLNTSFPYVTSILLSSAAKTSNVLVRHDARAFGRSNYTLKKSLSLTLNLVLHYSPLPSYFVAAMSIFTFCITVVFGAKVFMDGVANNTGVQGWASLVVLISFLGAQGLLTQLILLVYVSRIHQQLILPHPKQIITEIRTLE